MPVTGTSVVLFFVFFDRFGPCGCQCSALRFCFYVNVILATHVMWAFVLFEAAVLRSTPQATRTCTVTVRAVDVHASFGAVQFRHLEPRWPVTCVRARAKTIRQRGLQQQSPKLHMNVQGCKCCIIIIAVTVEHKLLSVPPPYCNIIICDQLQTQKMAAVP